MRWFTRSVLLGLLIVVVTPAPAHAWFEWLHRLSGPGPWYGLKVDVRAVCFGPSMSALAPAARPLNQLRKDLDDPGTFVQAEKEVRRRIAELRKINQSLNVLDGSELYAIENQIDRFLLFRANRFSLTGNRVVSADPSIETQMVAVDQSFTDLERFQAQFEEPLMVTALPGIFISLCPQNKLRTFAIELGTTISGTPGTPTYAGDHPIGMVIGTVGLSYRVPLSFDRDIIDIGTNVGGAVFYSDGFTPVYTFAIEPFVDLHLPTSFQLSDSKWERFFGRFTVRGGLQFFPGGFKAAEFAAQPGIPDISGREATPSVTVFFRIKGGPHRSNAPATPPRPGA